MKKIMTMVALAVLMVVTLTACGTSKPPKAEQIKADLIANQANIFNINYTEMSLGVKNVEITKRQTEDIYDEVYVSAQMTDDYYTVNADYVVYYEYFDEGGWCLSGIQLLSYESYAEKFPLTTEQLETIFSSYYSNCKIIEHDSYTNDMGNKCEEIIFTGSAGGAFINHDLKICYLYEFYDDCWNESAFLIEDVVNCDKMLGEWYLYRENETRGYYTYDIEATVNIMELIPIEDSKLQVTYSYEVCINNKYSGEITKESDTVTKVLSDSANTTNIEAYAANYKLINSYLNH